MCMRNGDVTRNNCEHRKGIILFKYIPQSGPQTLTYTIVATDKVDFITYFHNNLSTTHKFSFDFLDIPKPI